MAIPFFIGLLAIAAPPTEDAASREREALKGKWILEEQYSGGKKERQEWVKKANLTFEINDRHLVISSFGKKEEYSLEINCSRTPKLMVLKLVALDGKPNSDERPDSWAYEINGDAIRVAFSYDRKEFVKQIDPNSTTQVVMTAKRVK